MCAKFSPLTPKDWLTDGATVLKVQEDKSLLAEGPNPENETYTVKYDLPQGMLHALRLDVLGDSSLPTGAPGRNPENGNFVINEIEFYLVDPANPADKRRLEFSGAFADFTQDGFKPEWLVDGKDETAWAVEGEGDVYKVPAMVTMDRILLNWNLRLRWMLHRLDFSLLLLNSPVISSSIIWGGSAYP